MRGDSNEYVEVRISRSISERPLDFEITGVDCVLAIMILSDFRLGLILLFFLMIYFCLVTRKTSGFLTLNFLA